MKWSRRTFLLVLGAGALSVWGGKLLLATRQAHAPSPVFPTAELADLDSDVQARFAENVRFGFGWRRISLSIDSNGCFYPASDAEVRHTEALQGQKQDVLLYVMGHSGQLDWPKGHLGAKLKPAVRQVPIADRPPLHYAFIDGEGGQINPENDALIKGPAMMTGPANRLPLKDSQSATLSAAGLKATDPEVRPQLGDIDRHDLPTLLALRSIGNLILKPGGSHNGLKRQLATGGWQVVAVPILASEQRCAACHRSWERHPEQVALGQPLGAAMYAYRKLTAANSPEVTGQAFQKNVAGTRQKIYHAN